MYIYCERIHQNVLNKQFCHNLYATDMTYSV